MGILGHGLEVRCCAIAALERGVWLGVHSEASKAIARKHRGKTAGSGDQKTKTETKGLLGGSGDPHGEDVGDGSRTAEKEGRLDE